MQAQPFQIKVAQEKLDDLQKQLANTRWPDEIEGAGGDYGTNRSFMKALADYWQNQYDWGAQEAKLNQFAQFRAEIDGLKIHYIYKRGKGSNPTLLILTHGWLDSFYRKVKIVLMLADPADLFDVVVPSLSGFGFSDTLSELRNVLTRMADLWSRLMSEMLGYQRFAAAGGDFGSTVARLLVDDHLGLGGLILL